MYNCIKKELLGRELSFRVEKGAFSFQHPEFPLVDCSVICGNPAVCLLADYELKCPEMLSGRELFSIINQINYDNDSGNLETDGNGLIIFKINAFLPENRWQAAEVFNEVLTYFFKKAPAEFRKLEKSVYNHINHKETQNADSCI